MAGSNAEILLPVSIEEVNTPAGYLGYLFGGSQGYQYRLLKNHEDRNGVVRNVQQCAYTVKNMANQSFLAVSDCYVSMNTFWRSRDQKIYFGRDREHLKRLRTCFVDLDYYDLGLTQEEVLRKVHLMVKAGVIPQPTMVVSSGKGLYLIYKIKDEDAKALSRWSDIQYYLVDALKDVGADSHCTDPSRVLRVPGTINGKNGATVKVIEFYDITYTVHQLHKEYGKQYAKKKISKPATKEQADGRVIYPYGHATEKQRNYVRDLAKRLGLSEADYPNFADFHATDAWIKLHKDLGRRREVPQEPCYKTDFGYDLTEYTSIRARLDGYCEDISKLLLMRQQPMTNKRGKAGFKREIGLFLIRRFRRETGHTKEQALSEILELNARLPYPLDEDEVIHATASADKYFYAYRRSKIVEVLGITAEELKELPHLGAGADVVAGDRKQANRRAYERRLEAEGKSTKKDAIQERRAEIIALQERGMSAAQIQEKLCISKATYHRDIAAIEAARALEAAEEVIKEAAEQIAMAAKKTVETVAHTVQQAAKKLDLRAAICAAQNRGQMWQAWLSHFFSSPFEEERPKGVLPSSIWEVRYITRLRLGENTRWGDRGSGDDPDALLKKIK